MLFTKLSSIELDLGLFKTSDSDLEIEYWSEYTKWFKYHSGDIINMNLENNYAEEYNEENKTGFWGNVLKFLVFIFVGPFHFILGKIRYPNANIKRSKGNSY